MKISINSLLWIFVFFLSGCALFIKSTPPSLSWPLKNYRLSQTYAPRWNASHQGIDLAAPQGTPVFSSHSGRVVYTGNRLSGYGKTVIVEYSPHWSTLYAHLKTIQVKTGRKIPRASPFGNYGTYGKRQRIPSPF